MAFKLIESAQDRWRAVNAPHLVALVRAGATFINGKLVERPGEDPSPKPVPCHNSHSGSEVVFSVLVRLLSGTR
jgi:predicted component of type VI protein secretion system